MDIPIASLNGKSSSRTIQVKDFGGDALAAGYWPLSRAIYSGQETFVEGWVPEWAAARLAEWRWQVPGWRWNRHFRRRGDCKSPNQRPHFASFTTLSSGFALAPNQLGGVVNDPSGASVSSAIVELKNLSTNASWTASTGSDGRWLLPNLPSGTYQITARARAFKPCVTISPTTRPIHAPIKSA